MEGTMDCFPGDGVRALGPRFGPPAQRLEDVNVLGLLVCKHGFWHQLQFINTMYHVQRVQAVIGRIFLVRHSGR